MEVKDVIEFDQRTSSAKAWLVGVAISSIPGILFSSFITAMYLDHDSTKSGQNAVGLIFVLFFWLTGVILWAVCLMKFESVRKYPHRSEIARIRKQFHPLLSQFRNWLRSLRRLKKELQWAEWQLESSETSYGVLMENFSNGLQVHKFEIFESGDLVCSLESVHAQFTDNTSIQTYVSGSQTSGTITQSHSNPENFRMNASTTSRVSSHRSGLAYVELSGDFIPTTVFAFTEPNEARNAANLINSLSSNFKYNLESKLDDVELWRDAKLKLDREFNEFLSDSAAFRSEIIQLPKSIFLHELGQEISEEETVYLKF